MPNPMRKRQGGFAARDFPRCRWGWSCSCLSSVTGSDLEPCERGANGFVSKSPCDHLHASQHYAGALVEVGGGIGELEGLDEVALSRAVGATGLGERAG